jgi:hypothetical protein
MTVRASVMTPWIVDAATRDAIRDEAMHRSRTGACILEISMNTASERHAHPAVYPKRIKAGGPQ